MDLKTSELAFFGAEMQQFGLEILPDFRMGFPLITQEMASQRQRFCRSENYNDNKNNGPEALRHYLGLSPKNTSPS